jgi:oligo-1,6-glucosidase
MIALRDHMPALIYGDYKDLDPQNKAIFAYTRVLGPEKYLVILNLSSDPVSYSLSRGLKARAIVISNLPTAEKDLSNLKLRAWEARVYKLE